MIYIENILRLTYLLFIRKVLQDLQETIEFEIFGPSEIDETKNLDQIQNKGKLLKNFLFLKSFKINNGKYRAVKSDALQRDPIYLLFPAHIHDFPDVDDNTGPDEAPAATAEEAEQKGKAETEDSEMT